MLQIRKFICLIILLLGITGCQQTATKIDKEMVLPYVEATIKHLKGYQLVSAHYYQGKHLRINNEFVGEGIVIKTVIKYYDMFKDSKEHELVSVFTDLGYDLVAQGYIYGEDESIILGVDKINIEDNYHPVKYISAMNHKEIEKVNKQIVIGK